ncbi:MAG: hypothetical protein KC589_00110 [Nanoarchaeota archaeon]|nr:hypothetical protein [Nanoarchaeota archaeon]
MTKIKGTIIGKSNIFSHLNLFSEGKRYLNDTKNYQLYKIKEKDTDKFYFFIAESNQCYTYESNKFNPGIFVSITFENKSKPIIENPKVFENIFKIILIQEIPHYDKITFQKEEIERFNEFSNNKNRIPILLNAISPTIVGSKPLKESMLLQHIGSVDEPLHILFLGDPGTGKTVAMQEDLDLIDKKIYSLANEYDHTVVGYNYTKNFIFKGCNLLEVGLLGIWHNAILGFDEISRIGNKKLEKLFEDILANNKLKIELEDSTLEIPIKNSILSASNQKVNEFARKKQHQKKLLQIFDLVFVIEDIVKEDQEALNMLTEGILKNHMNKGLDFKIDKEFIKKYLIYLRESFKPKFTQEAIDYLKEKYVEYKQMSLGDYSPIDITQKQLKAMVKLSEAYAKLRLSNSVNLEDAQNSCNLFERCYETHNPFIKLETLNKNRLTQESTTMGSNKEIFMGIFLAIMREEKIIEVKYEQIFPKMQKLGYSKIEVDKIIESLKNEGEIFEPRKNIYKSISDKFL